LFLRHPYKCANDLTDNGILTEVVNIARQLKHFGGKSRGGRGCNWYDSYDSYSSCGCSCGREVLKREFQRRSVNEDPENIEELKKTYLANSNKNTASKIILSNDAWNAGQLVGPDYDKWVSYSAMLTMSLPSDEGIKDFAYFVYCMLNHQ